MKNISQKKLISSLIRMNTAHIEKAILLAETPEDKILKKPGEGAWNAHQTIEHLNRYFDFYLPEIEKCINKGIVHVGNNEFKSGWLGNYFANSMLNKNGKAKPIKTFKDKNPSEFGNIRENNMLIFMNNLKQLNDLIIQAEKTNLTKTKTSISLSKFIKLRLGDTLRFIINHNERHLNQAFRAAQLI